MTAVEGFYDSEELRKLIKGVKIECVGFEKEQVLLGDENSLLEEKVASFQRELNILSALSEAQELEDETGKDGEEEQTRLSEMERKLELQLLNQEIRAALPKLEAEALRTEADIYSFGKQVMQGDAGEHSSTMMTVGAKSVFQKSLEELEDEMGATVEARIKLRALMALDADASRKEKSILTSRIAALRDQLYSLLDEREGMREACKVAALSLHSEEARIAMLLAKHEQTRARIEPFHDGRGWQAEAFFSATAGRDGEIAVLDLPRVLQPWLPDTILSPEVIDETLSLIPNAVYSDHVSFGAFVELASQLNRAASSRGPYSSGLSSGRSSPT